MRAKSKPGFFILKNPDSRERACHLCIVKRTRNLGPPPVNQSKIAVVSACYTEFFDNALNL